MVSCPRCTMNNMPGARTCVACGLPFAANPQVDIDHEHALRLAAGVEEEGISSSGGGKGGTATEEVQDMQALLLDGTVRPRTLCDDGPNNNNNNIRPPEKPIHEAYRWADVIAAELQAMSDTLTSHKVCNVVDSSIAHKDRLIRQLLQLRTATTRTGTMQEMTEDKLMQAALRASMEDVGGAAKRAVDIAFGYVLTSRDCNDVWSNGVVRKGMKYPHIVLADDCVASYPSRQLTFETHSVPDYVWLVLLDNSAVDSAHVIKEEDRLLARHCEEDFWEAVSSTSIIQLDRPYHPVIIPLMCTANANFRRPYKPRISKVTANDSTNSSKQPARAGEGDGMTRTYHQAYTKMRDSVLASVQGVDESKESPVGTLLTSETCGGDTKPSDRCHR